MAVSESKTDIVVDDSVDELDSIWERLGGFGTFQVLNIVCCFLILLQFTISDIGYVITTAELKHRCLIAECEVPDDNYVGEEKSWLPSAIPTTTTGAYDSCRRYNTSSDLCSNSSFTNHSYICDSFVYETKEWTIHREDWNMHCPEDRTWLHFVGTLNIIGHISGSLYQGYLIDKFGRKTILVTLSLVVTVLGCIKSFSSSFLMFTAFEVIEGQAAANLYYGPFVLALESVAPKQRALVGLIMESVSSGGEIMVAVVQYFTFNWRTTLLICYLPFIITMSYYWLLPESIRWLLNQKRYGDAIVVFKRIATINGASYPEKVVDDLISAESSKIQQLGKSGDTWKEQLRSIWKSPILRRRFFANLVIRMANHFVFYGMTLESVTLSDSKFLDFSLSALAELPGYIIAYFLMDRIGRKRSLWIFTLSSGIASVTSGLIPAELGTVKLVIFLLGKLSVSGALCCLDVLTMEMYPTLVRSTVVSTNIFVGKTVTLVLPLVPLLSDFFPPLPLLIFGVASLIGLCTVVIFPETVDTKLPDSIEEAENLGRKYVGDPVSPVTNLT